MKIYLTLKYEDICLHKPITKCVLLRTAFIAYEGSQINDLLQIISEEEA